MGQQQLHHLCLKLKHAFLSRHPRTFLSDTRQFRGIIDVLYKQGFVAQVMPGDDRGPFVDLITSMNASKAQPASILTAKQHEKFEVLKRMQKKLVDLHAAVGSDGSRTLQYVDPATIQNKLDSALITQMQGNLPAVASVYLPDMQKADRLTPSDLLLLTWPQQRRLWLDLRYDQQQHPALTDMAIVSRGSRRVYASPEELEDVMSGRSHNRWKGSDVGAVTIIGTQDGEFLTAQEALKRGVGGEVLCVAK